MNLALTIDFGSTFTKGALFNLDEPRVLASAYEPSTVDTDVTIGLRAILARLQPSTDQAIETIPARVCSSAAGGLRMAVIGLVPSLSLEAAQRAALGAGAKIIGAYGHKLAPKALASLEAARADIVLLAGGIDGGDEETILHNARMLAGSEIAAPVIVAGNQSVSDECVELLCRAGRNAVLAANILPEIDRIEVGEVHAIIRDLFVRHITRAKGIERVGKELALRGPIIPTPSAVLRACQLLSEGAGGQKGWGDLVVIDIGGATTDVHSAGSGAPTRPGVITRGLPELFLKRTVEGDLGMRINAGTIFERAGDQEILRFASDIGANGLGTEALRAYVDLVGARPGHVPADDKEAVLDAALARSAIRIAMQRHAGSLREVYTASGMALVQNGKDLSAVSTVIGVGGVLAHGRHAKFALEGALGADAPLTLCPLKPRFLIDGSYLLYGLGLLADEHPAAALALGEKVLLPLD